MNFSQTCLGHGNLFSLRLQSYELKQKTNLELLIDLDSFEVQFLNQLARLKKYDSLAPNNCNPNKVHC